MKHLIIKMKNRCLMSLRRLLFTFWPIFCVSSNAQAQVTSNSQITPDQSAAGVQLPQSSANWTASEANGNFIDTGTSGQRSVTMVLPESSKHFEIILAGYTASIPSGATIAFHVTFDNGQSFSFSGEATSTDIQAKIDDSEIVSWTHNLTADQNMAVTFDTIPESPWLISLGGTTPTITAMAKAIALAGINGLPAPWSTSSAPPQTYPLQMSSATNPVEPQSQEAPDDPATTSNTGPAPAPVGVCKAAPHSFFSVQPTQYEWRQEGITDPQEAAAWTNCGFTPRFADVAKMEGLTPALVAPYINSGSEMDTNGSTDQVTALAKEIAAAEAPSQQYSIDINDMYAAGAKTDADANMWVNLIEKYPASLPASDGYTNQPTELNGNITQSIKALIAAGITPEQADKYLAQGLSFQNSDLVSSMIPFLNDGYSVEKATMYVSAGIPISQASEFDSVSQQACSGRIADEGQLALSNPYDISGQCFRMEDIAISQWLGQNSALANSDSVRLDFNDPPQGTVIQNAIVIGEAPFVYNSVSAGMQTVPEVKVLLLINSQ